jgi:Na+/proline symporter
MSEFELVQLALSIGNRIDLHWGLFVTVHVALLGAIVYVDRPLRPVEKIAALLMYFGFALVNYMQMQNQVLLLGAAYADIAAAAVQEANSAAAIIQRMALEHAGGRSATMQTVLVVSHLFMLLVVVLSVVFDRRMLPGQTGRQDKNDDG